MSAGQNTSSGKSRALLLVGLVAVLAVVAAVLTVVVSSKTYGPGAREVKPSLLVAAGSEHVDEQAGLVVPVPRGWRAETGDLVLGTTALVPDFGEDVSVQETAPGGIVLVGRMNTEAVGPEVDNRQAAQVLLMGVSEHFLPIPGRQVDEKVEEISGRAGDGWVLSYRLVPELPEGMPAPQDPVVRDGGVAYAAVVGEGENRWWLTYIGSPADGSETSPRTEWADAIVKKLRPTESGGDTQSEEPAEMPEKAPAGTI